MRSGRLLAQAVCHRRIIGTYAGDLPQATRGERGAWDGSFAALVLSGFKLGSEYAGSMPSGLADRADQT
ncbi:hypothetical protein D3C84_959390 [compost metagenome]